MLRPLHIILGTVAVWLTITAPNGYRGHGDLSAVNVSRMKCSRTSREISMGALLARTRQICGMKKMILKSVEKRMLVEIMMNITVWGN